jgi:hypothetical protein
MANKIESKMDLSDCMENLIAKLHFMSEACICIAQKSKTFGENDAFGMQLTFNAMIEDADDVFKVIGEYIQKGELNLS